MYKRASWFAALLFLLVSPRPANAYPDLADLTQKWLLAQSDEPTPPASQPTAKPGKPSGDEPTRPGAGGGDEPTRPGAGGGDEPTAPAAGGSGAPAGGTAEPPKPEVKVVKPKSKFGIGMQVRGIFVHPWLLHLFLDAATSLNSVALGGEFVYRKGTFDIIGSIDFGFYSPTDGNYLGKGDNPTEDTDYVQFDNLNLLAFSVHFIKHHPILPWLDFIWGGGVGLGVVLGNIFRVSNDPTRCKSISDARDEQRCYPAASDWDPKNPDSWLSDPANHSDTKDSPGNPKRFKEPDVWPVVPVVHLLVGFNFNITDYFSVRVDGGFRNAFYVGAAGHYFF